MAFRKRLSRGVLGVFAIGVMALISILLGTLRPEQTDAHDVPGEYHLEVAASVSSAAIGSPFTLTASINFSGGGSCDGSAGIFGCYQAVQWVINYNASLINAGANCGPSCPQIVRAGGAPTECSSESVNSGNQEILVGCIDLSGANLSYTGNVYVITVQCSAAGTANFTLGATSLVNDSATDQPIHVVGDSVDCSAALPTDTPVPPTNTPIPPTSTPGGPTNTSVPATATVAARDTNTPTPISSGTPGSETPPPGGETPPPTGGTPGTQPTSPSGTGGGGGVIVGPDTGSGGPGSANRSSRSMLIAGLLAAGITLTAGGAIARVARTNR